MSRLVSTATMVEQLEGLLGCGSASDDPAQQRVEKPVTVETQR